LDGALPLSQQAKVTLTMASDDVSSLGVRAPDLELCEGRIGYRFQNRRLLEAALTHASGADHRLSSNERLEFLGDAVLGLVVCRRIFHDFPDNLEGELTRIKSIVVSRVTCAEASDALGLEDFLILGKGMTTSPRVPRSVLSDVFEALIAAIYLDAGLDAAQSFIETHLGDKIEEAAAGGAGGNYKSQLQQLAQREHGVTPTYHVLDEKGPDHSKCFKICARLGHREFPPAWGRSKKESEQRAARNAIYALRGDDTPHPAD
jgi:ribonuclease-3